MKTEMTIAKRFMVTAASSMVLILGLMLVAYFASQSTKRGIADLADNSVPSISTALKLEGDVNRLRVDYWRHMASNTPADKDKIEADIQAHAVGIEQDIALYRKTMDNNEEDRANIAHMTSGLQAIVAAWPEVRTVSRTGDTNKAVTLYNATVLLTSDAVEKSAQQTVAYNSRGADQLAASARGAATHSLILSTLLGLVALVLSVMVSWFMIQSTNKVLRQTSADLDEGAEQVASAANQVSSSSQNLAQGASQQAASIEETSAAATEINSMAMRNTENAADTATIVAHSVQSFQQTNRLLEALLTAMEGIDNSSQKIAKIIKVIDEIAFQTNILALNAAVEAARAGEAGMGFAVVADEVRNLAQRSAQAAKDTAILIEDSIGKSADGKSKVDQVATAIRSITAESARMKSLVDEIHLGSSEQAKGIEQISSSIQRMEQVTQSAAASAEETAAATEELNGQAKSMQDVVGRLISLVEGGNARRRSTSRSSGAHKRSKPSFGKLTPASADGMF